MPKASLESQAAHEVSGCAASTFAGKFLFSAGLIFAITGMAKIYSSFGSAKALLEPDPIFGVQFRHLMFAVGVVEIGASAFCIASARTRTAALLVAWLSCLFLFYRLGVWWLGWQVPCRCLGTLSDSLHLAPATVDNLMKIVLAYLLVGSVVCLVYYRRPALASIKPL
jgi:hypothetical protein